MNNKFRVLLGIVMALLSMAGAFIILSEGISYGQTGETSKLTFCLGFFLSLLSSMFLGMLITKHPDNQEVSG